MFNFKNYKTAADLTKKINPQDIPGATIEQKAAYISEYLDKEIGERLKSGEIDIDTAYKLLSETKVVGVPENFDFLEKYRFNISQLLQQASFIKSEMSETGLSPEQISQLIIRKLLERVNQVFIPELVELNRTSKRSSDEALRLLTNLTTYEDPEQISSIKLFISREIEREINEVVNEFKDIRDRALKIQGFDDSDLLIMLTHTPVESLKVIFPNRRKTGGTPLPSKFTDPEVVRQVEFANEEVQKLARKVTMKGDAGWSKVLGLSEKLSQEELEKWKRLVDHPIKFNLYEIVKNAGLMSAGLNEDRTEKPEVVKQAGFRNPLLREKYYSVFKPQLDPSTGRPFLSESEMRYMDERFGGKSPNELPYDMDERLDFIKRSQSGLRNRYALDRLYEFISEGYDGQQLKSLVLSNNIPLDQAGLAIQFYFRVICKSDRDLFLRDLRTLGLEEHYGAISEAGLEVDQNYEAVRLTVNSNQEYKIIKVLRNEFGIDAVPFPVLIPVPTDCPTNTENFDIDFMIFVDVLDYIDPETFQPKITQKAVFVGEYFGFNSDKEKEIVDRGRPWVTPEGKVFTPPPKISTVTGDVLKTYSPLEPGKKSREGHIYDLKTMWKKFTYNTVSHIMGADALYFDDADLKIPYKSIAQKLDDKDIIYNYSGCSNANDLCKAKKMIENSTDFELKENLNNPEYHRRNVYNEKNKCIRLVDSIIINFKFQKVLRKVKKEFIGKSGFDRQTMFFHKEYMDSLRTNIQNALRILSSNKSTMQEKLSAQQAIESNQAEMRSLEYSPLYTFKQRYEELLRQPEIAGTLNQLNKLREAILSEDVEPTLSNVRVLMLQIDEGIFGFVPNPEQS